ncbi:MAG: hypothetical protein R6V06_09405 [Kiritimatiellia bacterium]
MKKQQILVVIEFFILFSTAQAIVDDSVESGITGPSELNVEQRRRNAQSLLEKKAARLKAARIRAEKIRTISPENIPLWINSDKTDEDLNKLTSASINKKAGNKKKKQTESKTFRKYRFIGVFLLFIVCCILNVRKHF